MQIFLSFFVAFLVLIATALFTKRATCYKANASLASAYLSMAFVLLYTLLTEKYSSALPSFLVCSHIFFFSFTSLFIYIYVMLTTGFIHRMKNIWHLLSLVPALGGYIYYQVTALSGGLPMTIVYLLILAIFISYLVQSFQMVSAYSKKERRCHVSRKQVKWLYYLLLTVAVSGGIQFIWITGIAMSSILKWIMVITYCAILTFLFVNQFHLSVLYFGMELNTNDHHRLEFTSPEKLERYKQQLKLIMEDNLTFRNPDLCNDAVAKQMNLKPRQFSHIIREISGKSFPRYVNTLRIQYAVTILQDPVKCRWNSAFIANECGFRTREHFSKVFKETVNISFEKYQHQLLKKKSIK